MGSDISKPHSESKMVVGLSLLGAVILIFVVLAVVEYWATGISQLSSSSAHGRLWGVTLFAIMGGLALVVGASLYAAVLATHGFTFDFSRPVWRTGFAARMWLVNIFVPFMLLLAAASFVVVASAPVLMMAGLSTRMALIVPFFGILIPGQLFLAWCNIWMPVSKSLIRKRMLALGITQEQLATGVYVGLSDPMAASSLKKFSVAEGDVGMLWLTPDAFVYQGDGQNLRIGRSQFVAVKRKADKGGMAVYVGSTHVVVRWRDAADTQRRIRLQVKDRWTLTGTARALDDLAQRLNRWQAETPPATGGQSLPDAAR